MDKKIISNMYNKELEIAKIAAKKAGLMLKKEFKSYKNNSTKFKSNSERVTQYDKKAEKIILDILNKNFPDYRVLSEESGFNHKKDKLCWVVDPLDGTTNFTINHPLFAVAIALLKKDEVVLGVVYNPILDELYWASKNGGAYKNGHRLKVSQQKNLSQSVITYCHGSGEKNTRKAYKLYQNFHDISHHCRHFGCSCLELSMLAAGNTEVHMESGARLWDVAAGIIIAKEAGAKVTDWQNKAWDKNSVSILAANKKIQPYCLKELKRLKLV